MYTAKCRCPAPGVRPSGLVFLRPVISVATIADRGVALFTRKKCLPFPTVRMARQRGGGAVLLPETLPGSTHLPRCCTPFSPQNNTFSGL